MALYKRDDSPYWWMALERKGQKTIRQSTRVLIDGGTPTQTKANAALAQKVYAAEMGDLARERHDLPVNRPIITFAEFRAWYFEHVGAAKRGKSKERYLLRALGYYFDPVKLHSLEPRDIIEWRTARAKEAAPGTVNRELGLLKSVLRSAMPRYLERNPAAGVQRLPVPERVVRLLAPAEERTLLSICDQESRALIICALDTLQRLSTVVNMKRAYDHGAYLSVPNSKTSYYEVPISTRLRAALDALPKAGPFFFPGAQRSTVDVQRVTISRWFTDLLRAAKIPAGRKADGLTFHSLRHTGASRMLAAGVDIKTVQQLGGWKNLRVLERYLHPTDAQRREAVETIGRASGVNRKRETARFRGARNTRPRPRRRPKTQQKSRKTAA